MQKHGNLVDLVKSFPANIYLQNLASIQERTSPVEFAHLAEKSENGSISNLSTKIPPPGPRRVPGPSVPAWRPSAPANSKFVNIFYERTSLQESVPIQPKTGQIS